MRIFAVWAFICAIEGQIASETIDTKETASSFLSRAGRIFFWEEAKQGNLERECIEEVKTSIWIKNGKFCFQQGDPCNREENWEVFDNDELHRESWSKLKGCFTKLTSQNVSRQNNVHGNDSYLMCHILLLIWHLTIIFSKWARATYEIATITTIANFHFQNKFLKNHNLYLISIWNLSYS